MSKFLDNNSTAAVILNVERGIGLFKFGFMIIIIAIASCFQTFANPSSTHTKNRRKKKNELKKKKCLTAELALKLFLAISQKLYQDSIRNVQRKHRILRIKIKRRENKTR